MLAGRVHLHLVTFVLVQFFANRCLKGESALSHGASAGASGGQCHGKAGARSGHLLPSATVATYFQKQKQAKNKNNEKRRNASLSGIETLRWLRSHHAVRGQVEDVCSARTKTPDATSGTGTGSERRVSGAAWPAAGDTCSSPLRPWSSSPPPTGDQGHASPSLRPTRCPRACPWSPSDPRSARTGRASRQCQQTHWLDVSGPLPEDYES